ncbi:hypothetical protein P4O66_008999, partial [Electrophorus voltai]
KQVFEAQNIYKKRIQKWEGERVELMTSIESLKSSAHTVVKDTEMMFHELIRSIWKKVL